MDQYVKINIKESVRTKLKKQAADKRMTLADYIEWLANQAQTPDEADVLMDKMENSPEDLLSAEDRKLFDELEPGELPECCQELYSGKKCRHWKKTYVNYYGRKVLGYQNTLTGGTNYDYQTLYEQ
jgi:hypothetical protein